MPAYLFNGNTKQGQKVLQLLQDLQDKAQEICSFAAALVTMRSGNGACGEALGEHPRAAAAAAWTHQSPQHTLQIHLQFEQRFAEQTDLLSAIHQLNSDVTAFITQCRNSDKVNEQGLFRLLGRVLQAIERLADWCDRLKSAEAYCRLEHMRLDAVEALLSAPLTTAAAEGAAGAAAQPPAPAEAGQYAAELAGALEPEVVRVRAERAQLVQKIKHIDSQQLSLYSIRKLQSDVVVGLRLVAHGVCSLDPQTESQRRSRLAMKELADLVGSLAKLLLRTNPGYPADAAIALKEPIFG